MADVPLETAHGSPDTKKDPSPKTTQPVSCSPPIREDGKTLPEKIVKGFGMDQKINGVPSQQKTR